MEDNQFKKILPQNIEAEQSVLGAMIIDNDSISVVMEIINENDFYRADHKEIFIGIRSIFNIGENVDLVTLSEKLSARGILEKVGGIEYLSILATSVPTTSNAAKYANIIKEKSLLRGLIKASGNILEKSYEATDEAKSVLEYAEDTIFQILSKNEHKGFLPMREVLVEAIKKVEFAYNNRGKVTGIPTGFKMLDRVFSGLQNSDLILIAARPAMGKTAFALNIAQYASVVAKKHTAIFSLEMSKEQLVTRMIASQTHLDSAKLRDGELKDDDWAKLVNSIGPMSDAPLYIDDSAGVTVTEIRAKCRKLKLQGKLDMVIIDYLQLMDSAGRHDNRQTQISEISRSLKILAKDLNVPVICLSQLSRGPESRADHRPMLSDLRESGAIEQDADIVMFIYRDDYYNEDTDKKNIAEIIIAKHRNGSTGKVELVWLGQYTKFVDKHED